MIPTQEITNPRYRPTIPSDLIVLTYTSTIPLNCLSPPWHSNMPNVHFMASSIAHKGIRERITFKLCLLVYKARNGMAPIYTEDLCLPVSSVSTSAALRSAARGDFVIPRTRLHLGNRAFSVAGPAAWNSLPSDIQTASTLSAFKNRLKTHLFLQSYYVLSS